MRLPSPARFLAATVVSVPIVSGPMWLLRRHELETGLPRDARGTVGCSYDANLAAVYGSIVGLAAAGTVGATVLVSSRRPRATSLVAGLCFSGWLVVAAILIGGTMA